jgi:hypothetical protein
MARLTRCSAKYTADCRGKTPSIAGFLQYLFGIRADLLLYGLKARRIAQLREAATNFFNLAKLNSGLHRKRHNIRMAQPLRIVLNENQ